MFADSELETLLDDWRDAVGSNGRFVRDGPVDAEAWRAAPCKVMVLLKESHDKRGHLTAHGYDLRRVFSHHTWDTPARWGYALSAVAAGHDIPLMRDATDRRKAAFRACAVANVKKVAGGTSSNAADVATHADRYGDRLRRQIDLLEPDVVVCGGTFLTVCQRVHNDLTAVGPDDRCYRRGEAIWIDFFHPSARFGTRMPYYALASYYRNALRFP